MVILGKEAWAGPCSLPCHRLPRLALLSPSPFPHPPTPPLAFVCRSFDSSSRASTSSSSDPKSPSKPPDATPFQDTRIHWSSPDDGWIGRADTSQSSLPSGSDSDPSARPSGEVAGNAATNSLFLGLISQARDSHYQFLGVSPDAELEEIKAAYRRLSKLYHPDSTSLPLDSAAEKFVRLRQAYNVLSSVEERRFYDWTLAQEVSRQQGGRFIWPFEADRTQRGDGSGLPTWESEQMRKDDASGGNKVKLSDQAQSALAFDFFTLLFSICCIVYVAYFKH